MELTGTSHPDSQPLPIVAQETTVRTANTKKAILFIIISNDFNFENGLVNGTFADERSVGSIRREYNDFTSSDIDSLIYWIFEEHYIFHLIEIPSGFLTY